MFVDAHVHFDSVRHHTRLMADMDRTGAGQFCVLVVERFDDSPRGFKQAEAIWLKLREPTRAFLFGGLDYTGLFNGQRSEPEAPLVEQVELIREMGLDGLKLISGKPNVRHAIGRSLDDPVFEPMLGWLEATGFPVLWHVSDPPEFWDKNQVPQWAREKGWWYEANIPARAQIEQEIATVFSRHPNLNLILPHFFFLSNRLDDAAKLLERYPSFYLDLAPGVEMLHNFTKNRDEAHEFFLRFSDRIIFGTDIGLLDHCNSPDRGVMVRRFLETDDIFPVPNDPVMTPDERPDLHSLGLPPDAVEQIASANFYRVVGRTTPLALNAPSVRRAMRELIARSEMHEYDAETAKQVLNELK
jgi:hypothetical protein